MRSTSPVEHVDMRARLRQVDEHVTPHRQSGPGAGAVIVPAPRRVPVFLRCHAGSPGFGELTITHPVVASRGDVPTA